MCVCGWGRKLTPLLAEPVLARIVLLDVEHALAEAIIGRLAPDICSAHARVQLVSKNASRIARRLRPPPPTERTRCSNSRWSHMGPRTVWQDLTFGQSWPPATIMQQKWSLQYLDDILRPLDLGLAYLARQPGAWHRWLPLCLWPL